MPVRSLVLTTLLLCLSVGNARAEEWPGWRGPRGDGTSAESGIPQTWGPTENVRWKTAIPGIGHSSPIVWGDRVFVTSCIEEQGQRMLFAVDRLSGKIVWQREVVTAPLERKHNLNSYASATPVTDGKHVWVSFLRFPDAVLTCYDFDGNKVWQRSPGKLLSVHGFCSSPILHKDLVILNGDQDAQAYIVALDKNTGVERWRIDRPNRTRSYCTPILIHTKKHPEITQMVLSGSKCVTGYDADTGKLLWINRGPTEQYVASLVYHDGVLFLTAGFPEHHLMGIDPDGEGDITDTKHILWHIPHADNGPRGASYVPSPLAFGGHFYVVSDPGFLGCVEARTGKRLWMERLGRHHSASGVLVEGRMYWVEDSGTTWVVKADPKFEVLHKNVLGEECYASPAVAHGQIFLRCLHHLYCIGEPAPKAQAAWKSLFDGKSLAGWKATFFSDEKNLSVKDGAIVLKKGQLMTGVKYTRGDFPKMDYEVALEGKKLEGSDFFCTTTFPVGDSFCSLVVGGWGGDVVGLSSLNSQDASENETSTRKEFRDNQWYRVRIRVTKDRIQAWIDDEKLVDADTAGKRIATRIECRGCQPFGLATYDTTGAIRNIRVRALTAVEKKEAAETKPGEKD
jgi:outer membrane protein assembly factor BamB